MKILNVAVGYLNSTRECHKQEL